MIGSRVWGGGWGCFFFQAEDGIRDYDVTGVQTCALPIFVPDFLTVRLWQQHVSQLITRELYDPMHDVLLLDGIPRSVPQAKTLEEHIDPLMIIHLVCDNIDEMVRRIQKRAQEQCRTDDADETVIRKRFEVYEEQTAPVLTWYDKDLVEEINAIGTQAEVFLRILTAVVPVVSTRNRV